MRAEDFTQEMLYADLRAKWPAPACLAVKQVFEAYLTRNCHGNMARLNEALHSRIGRDSLFTSLLQDIARDPTPTPGEMCCWWSWLQIHDPTGMGLQEALSRGQDNEGLCRYHEYLHKFLTPWHAVRAIYHTAMEDFCYNLHALANKKSVLQTKGDSDANV